MSKKYIRKFGEETFMGAEDISMAYFDILGECLRRFNCIKEDKWHTIQFYYKINKDKTFYIDAFKISSCKRRKPYA